MAYIDPITGLCVGCNNQLPPTGSQTTTTTEFPAFTFPSAHVTTPSSFPLNAQGYATNQGYVLYGRHLINEMLGGIEAHGECMTEWASANTSAKTALSNAVLSCSSGFRSAMLYGMAGQGLPGVTVSYVDNVPTKEDQRVKLVELAAAAKALLEDPEIDPTQNAQLASGLSAAMGGGHNSVTAIKDNITFEQKLQAKQLALATYAQALDAYYKTYTATASQIGTAANQLGLTTSASVPTVVPFESQLAGDIYANWQDIKNTGQMRDQQIRQTINGAKAFNTYDTVSESWIYPSGLNLGAGAWNAETTASIMGIKSQYRAAATY